MEQLVSIAIDEYGGYYINALMELENSSEAEEDKKEEKKFKEYRIHSHVRLSALYLNSCSNYGHGDSSNRLDVLLVVVTSPPEV